MFFTEFPEKSDKKLMTLKGFEPAAPPPLVRDWIFKLSPIHASVIYQFL